MGLYKAKAYLYTAYGTYVAPGDTFEMNDQDAKMHVAEGTATPVAHKVAASEPTPAVAIEIPPEAKPVVEPKASAKSK